MSSSVSSEFYQLQLQHVLETQLLHLGLVVYTRLKLLHCELFFFAVVVVFITPAGRRSGAAAGPASLTLQSGLAQESVVV